ncbi:MAG: CDP-alcohol phosphatidyltransferase family protein [Clostridiales bacterium]|nr:CDP-alcohol phosphatidyltransferase family protein [Clostridiales bacterium]
MCGILDVLDGFIARKFNVTSKLGVKLDSIPDMIMIFVILFRFVPTMGLNLFMIFIVATLTAIEEILIDLTMDSLDLDRKFYFNIK